MQAIKLPLHAKRSPPVFAARVYVLLSRLLGYCLREANTLELCIVRKPTRLERAARGMLNVQCYPEAHRNLSPLWPDAENRIHKTWVRTSLLER
jgi:hypothetical protein